MELHEIREILFILDDEDELLPSHTIGLPESRDASVTGEELHRIFSAAGGDTKSSLAHWRGSAILRDGGCMHPGTLARRADEAKMRLEIARAKLERTARRWTERRGPRALRELESAAEEFDAAEAAVEAAARAWARASIGRAPSSPSVPLRDGMHVVAMRSDRMHREVRDHGHA